MHIKLSQECIKCSSTYLVHEIQNIYKFFLQWHTTYLVFIRLRAKLEVNKSTALALRASRYFICNICTCSVLLLIIWGCVFACGADHDNHILLFFRYMKGSVVWTNVGSFFCFSHYHKITNTAIFWIYMLQYFMWLQVFVLLLINVFFSVLIFLYVNAFVRFSLVTEKSMK